MDLCGYVGLSQTHYVILLPSYKHKHLLFVTNIF